MERLWTSGDGFAEENVTRQFRKQPSVLFQFIFRFCTSISLVIFFVRYLKEPDVKLFVFCIAIFAFILGVSFGNVRWRQAEQ